MPAHIGAFTKLKVFAAFLMLNLHPGKKGKDARSKRRTTKKIRNRLDGTPDAPNHRAKYIAWKKIMQVAEGNREKREHEFDSYETFRTFLDRLDPEQPYIDGHAYTDQREWDLCLQPGTPFD